MPSSRGVKPPTTTSTGVGKKHTRTTSSSTATASKKKKSAPGADTYVDTHETFSADDDDVFDEEGLMSSDEEEEEEALLLGNRSNNGDKQKKKKKEKDDEGDEKDEDDAAAGDPSLETDRFERLETMLTKASVYGEIIRDQIREDAAQHTTAGGVAEQQQEKRPRRERPQPQGLKGGGKLLEHQLDGTQWLLSLYKNGVNGILADDMGLGKTVQTISFIVELFNNRVFGTHLIVAPLSCLENWRAEFERWAPWISTVVYHGDREARKDLRGWLRKRAKNRKKNEIVTSMLKDPPEEVAQLVGGVVITSYEMIMLDATYMRKSLGVKWRTLIVDEAHRLKNFECKLIKTLKTFNIEARVLLTGTPLQNKLSELWSILNFIVPELFDKLSEFEQWFEFDLHHQQQQDDDDENDGDNNDGENGKQLSKKEQKQQKKVADAKKKLMKGSSNTATLQRDPEQQLKIVAKMHRVLRPFMLRRTKAEIASIALPPKHEVVLSCPLHKQQQLQYEEILTSGQYCHNRLMQLRKVCCHPHLFREFDPFYDDIVENDGSTHFKDQHKKADYLMRLIEDSSKLHLLHRMLPLLRKGGHKLLLFSQFTSNLDLIEDYLSHVHLPYVRLDGSTDIETRMKHIKTFSGKKKDVEKGDESEEDDIPFIFLISTRAGGLGLNLVAADTVVLYDCDFNPYNDLQAIDRCHRIGQKQTVVVYRLVCPETVEEVLLNTALRKLRLEKLVIGAGKFHELHSIGNTSNGGTTDDVEGDAVPTADEWNTSALQDIHTQTLNMRFGDTLLDDLGDDALRMYMDREAVSAYCRKMKSGGGDDGGR